jgi:hypothetical protein
MFQHWLDGETGTETRPQHGKKSQQVQNYQDRNRNWSLGRDSWLFGQHFWHVWVGILCQIVIGNFRFRYRFRPKFRFRSITNVKYVKSLGQHPVFHVEGSQDWWDFQDFRDFWYKAYYYVWLELIFMKSVSIFVKHIFSQKIIKFWPLKKLFEMYF